MHCCILLAQKDILVYIRLQVTKEIHSTKGSAPQFIIVKIECHDFMKVKAIRGVKNFLKFFNRVGKHFMAATE